MYARNLFQTVFEEDGFSRTKFVSDAPASPMEKTSRNRFTDMDGLPRSTVVGKRSVSGHTDLCGCAAPIGEEAAKHREHCVSDAVES